MKACLTIALCALAPPIGRRFTMAFLFMVLGFAVEGSTDRGIRRLWPMTFVGFIVSLSLLLLCGFKWSWGWWL